MGGCNARASRLQDTVPSKADDLASKRYGFAAGGRLNAFGASRNLDLCQRPELWGFERDVGVRCCPCHVCCDRIWSPRQTTSDCRRVDNGFGWHVPGLVTFPDRHSSSIASTSMAHTCSLGHPCGRRLVCGRPLSDSRSRGNAWDFALRIPTQGHEFKK